MLGEPADQARVDAAGRLVEQDQPRLQHQHLGELDQLLLAVGQGAGLLVRRTGRGRRTSSSSRARSASCAADRVRRASSASGASGTGATTFSSTVIDLNSRVTWKVRARPEVTARCHGGSRSIRLPSNQISPASAFMPPVTRLNSVVLPDPFGPDQRGDRCPRGR